ncbi:MAG: hypothetical protein IT168_07010 [Bryobacterales bacterium]|nr:hypothetical protein [Bryobacterales bacterium]
MKYLAWLDKTLLAKLAEQPIGRPVFLRATLQLTADHGRLRQVAEEIIRLASGWMNSTTAATHWQGGPADGHLAALVSFAQGQSALISSELTHGDEPTVDLLLMGQHGAIRFTDIVLE